MPANRVVPALMLLVPLIIDLVGPVTPARAAASFALESFATIWEAADQPVAAGQIQRTWLWGPAPVTSGSREPYREAPAGRRVVQYFDKARMEDQRWRSTDPLWQVTNGLLVVELMSGRVQVGDNQFEDRQPARVNIAGDPDTGPTYADLAGLGDRPPPADNAIITERLDSGGRVITDQSPPVTVTTARRSVDTRHSVADPFWQFMLGPGAVGGNPFFATGLPLTEPYWATVQVGGQTRSVLVQAFERRVLTFTPGNPAGFTIEMGNVGQHYYRWRYGRSPAPDDSTLVATPLRIPPSLQAVVNADRERRFVDQRLNLPPGFQISLFALAKAPRFMAFSPGGILHVAEPWEGTIAALPDRDGDGVADERIVVVGGLNRPSSLAFQAGGLYVAESNRIIRLDDDNGDLKADRLQPIVTDLPNHGQHWTRTILFGADGKLYVSVGSSCNVCQEEDWHRATIIQYNADGTGGRVYARGLRNSVGLAWQPGSGRLFATENGRDNLGDDEPPEEVNLIRDGGDYGWPRCHGANLRDPRFGTSPDACQGQIAPVALMQAHSAPLGLTFLDQSAWPAGYRGDLLVAFHGSWNRSVPTGYKLVRLRFRDGAPTGQSEDFLTGFLTTDGAWSRPVGVTMGPDQALFVSDDRGGAIFRITPSG